MDDVLQKVIAESGLASRRQAEALIKRGSVKVNNVTAKLGDRANPDKDIIRVSGKLIPKKEEKIYLKLNKPIDYTCSNKRFPGEKNIFDLVKDSKRLFSVGRLDKNSRGLILLTNDGELSQKLTHPSFKHQKTYVVKADRGDRGEITFKEGWRICTTLKQGVQIGGGDGVARVKRSEYLENNSFKLILTEGKKRQIRRMFGVLNLRVYDLKRIEFAGIRLDNLEEGAVKPLTEKELKLLKRSV